MDKPNIDIAVDLDGTLAYYNGWVHHESIGEPIPHMLAQVKQWLSQGHSVHIFTARMNADESIVPEVEQSIKNWCVKHIGVELPITGKKELYFTYYYDDLAKSVVPNTGLQDTEVMIQRFAAAHGAEPWCIQALKTLCDVQEHLHPTH